MPGDVRRIGVRSFHTQGPETAKLHGVGFEFGAVGVKDELIRG